VTQTGIVVVTYSRRPLSKVEEFLAHGFRLNIEGTENLAGEVFAFVDERE
jgi:hypothetical protein